ncbi:MAG TPA: rod shape-determining protein MreC, partial [Terriglobia bacterium]|nr:rod shape-determining protein MreC [Terriglobia bacterium]
MSDSNEARLGRSVPPLSREAPEKMQAFMVRHGSVLILAGVMVAQLLLLSFQISRNNNVRLIKVWTVAVLQPFQYSLGGIVDAARHGWSAVQNLRGAERENQELHSQLLEARSQILRMSEQAAEDERLRGLLEFRKHQSFSTIAAEVIASSPGENSNAIFVDKGSDAGLTPDLAVITPEGVVGKTIAVFSHTAQVLLLSDSSSGVGCILERSRVQGVLKGDGQNFCQLHYVMNEETVEPGEAVLTSGLDQIYPKGLRVGTVVRAGEGNIYKSIAVKPAVAL